ncbi:MAG: hypothetical protein ACFFCO_01815 [Promethearchaeota archaeon]
MRDPVRWALAVICLTLGSIFFNLGWIIPFASLGLVILQLMGVIFSIIAALFVAVALLLVWKSWAKS